MPAPLVLLWQKDYFEPKRGNKYMESSLSSLYLPKGKTYICEGVLLFSLLERVCSLEVFSLL